MNLRVAAIAGCTLFAASILSGGASRAQSNTTSQVPAQDTLDLLLDLTRGTPDNATGPGKNPQTGGKGDEPDNTRAGNDCPPGTVAVRDACEELQRADPDDPEPGQADPGGDPPLLVPGILADLIRDLISRRPRNPGPTGGGGSRRVPSAGQTPSPPGGAAPRRAARTDPAPLRRAVQALSPPTFAAARALSGDYVPDEVLIVVDGDANDAQAVAAANNLDVRALRTSALLGAVYARLGIPDGRSVALVLGQLTGDARVIDRVPNHLYTLQQADSLPQYALAKLTLDPGATAQFGKGVRIAVIDTAVDDDVPALKGAVTAFFDALPGLPVRSRRHGTSIAALIAGRGPFAGAAPGADLLIARAFGVNASGKTVSNADAILSSLDWAWEKGASVVNMSFTGPRNRLIELGCDIAARKGIHLVAAAGNNGPGAPFAYPAAFASVIAVTAIDADDRIMEMANRGRYVLFSAPGVDLVAPVPGGVDFVTGTSFAAALVSGIAAGVHGAHSGLTPRLLKLRLSTSAKDLGKPGRDETFGLGLIDTAGALK